MPHTRYISKRAYPMPDGSFREASVKDRDLTWERSTKQGGKLLLTDHPHRRLEGGVRGLRASADASPQMIQAIPTQPGVCEHYGVASPMASEGAFVSLRNEAYAKLRGKLYKGNAALGVTLASWQQSRNMIVDRYHMLSLRADRMAQALGSQPRAKQAASAHLEIIFGWTPLVQDIVASTTTVIQNAVPLTYVKARAVGTDKVSFSRRSSGNSGVTESVVTTSLHATRYSATVRISNPNLWLAERAGLLNLPAVAWDVVPWSFVVNMFVNTGQLVNSVTDYCGLEFLTFSHTESTVLVSDLALSPYYSEVHGTGSAQAYRRDKTRVLLSRPPRPNFEFRVPDLNWSTAAMAASLFTQKFSAISRVISPFLKSAK